jgi:hypothetical protein
VYKQRNSDVYLWFYDKRCAYAYIEVILQTQTTLPHLGLGIIKMQAYFLGEKMEAYKNKATYLIE